MAKLPGTNENGTDESRLGSKLKKLLLYRLIIAVFFLIVTIAVQSRRDNTLIGDLFNPLYLFSCILFLFTIFGTLSLKYLRRLKLLAIFQLLFDLGSVTVLVYMTGGIESSFSSLYVLVIFSAALLLGRRASLFTALACSLIYGVLLDLQYFGFISPLKLATAPLHPHDSGTYFFDILVDTAAFFLVGFLAGYFARELQSSKIRIFEKESDLRNLQTLHTSIVRSMSSGLLTVDLEGRIKFSNDAAVKLLGISPEGFSNRLIIEIFPDIDFSRVQADTSTPSTLPPTRLETRYNHPAGLPIVFGYSASALREENEKLFGYLILFTDLTKRKAFEEHIQRMERLVLAGRLAAEIAHEIKNPLAAMSGAAQMLSNETGQNPLNLRLIGLLQREIERVNTLVTQFLWMAKESPQSERIEEVAVCPAIEEIVTLLKANKKTCTAHTVRTDFRAAPLISIDPLHLRRVLWNLFVNAIEAMPTGGELTVAVSLQCPPKTPNTLVRIDVADTGCGISDPVLQRIFDPFFTTKDSGTGLGLSIVYQLVEKAAGRIEVKRKHAGVGTTFSLFFPLSTSFSLAK